MRRALFALCAICGALAWPAVAGAGTMDRDLTMTVITYLPDPCNPGNNLNLAFAGLSTLHVTEKVDGTNVTWAKVDASQTGLIATTINGVQYVGALSYSSKVNLNNQNQNAAVNFVVAGSSLDGTSTIAFSVTERVVFNANDPITPVSGTSEIAVASCPA